MNDRYLFKAKREDWKELPEEDWCVVGYYIQIEDKSYIVCEAETSCIDSENTDFYATEWYEIDPSTICQCTGLRDKNGNLIWENDVVMCNIEECSGHVAWNESECGFYFIAVLDDGTRDVEPLCDYANELEVIGSIFDSPKLLEMKECE